MCSKHRKGRMNGNVSDAQGTAHSCSGHLCQEPPATADASSAFAALPHRLYPSQSSSHLGAAPTLPPVSAAAGCPSMLPWQLAHLVGCARSQQVLPQVRHPQVVSLPTELSSPGPPHRQQLRLQPLLALQQSGSDVCAAPQSAAAAGAAVPAGLPGWLAGPAKRSGCV